MTSISGTQTPATQLPNAKILSLIVGLVCLLRFVAAIIALAIPPDPMALEWRVAFMEQFSARSILLLLGAALILYSLIGNRTLTRYCALACLFVGLMLPLSSVIIVRDNLMVQKQAFNTIDQQAEAVQSQIDAAKGIQELPPQITLEQLQAASTEISNQAETLKQNARSTGGKSILSTSGNVLVMGFGLMGLGRYGIKRST